MISSPSQLSEEALVRFKVLPNDIFKFKGELFQRTISLAASENIFNLVSVVGVIYFGYQMFTQAFEKLELRNN